MNGMIQKMRAAAQKRAAYNRTVREIRSLTDAEANDLGIARGDAHRMAWDAVYGR